MKYCERTVILRRNDEKGFGFRIGGENPVFVDHVHEHGEAWRAGIRKYDRLIKFNGTSIRHFEHERVVEMFREHCHASVNLTLESPVTVNTS